MSRAPEDISNLGSQLRKGMDSLTILDPGRLRVPFGVNTKMRNKSWMTVPPTDAFSETLVDVVPPGEHFTAPTPTNSTNSTNLINSTNFTWEIPGWVLAVGYSLFGLGLALCNLLIPQHTGKVCTGTSPIPLLCLLLQALACKKGRWVGGGLLLAALSLPSACAFWSLYLAIPLVLASSFLVLCSMQRGVFAWVCVSGVCLGLLLPLILEPKWGMTVAGFFLCALCFQSGLGCRVGLTVK